jgi:hypothetical protein
MHRRGKPRVVQRRPISSPEDLISAAVEILSEVIAALVLICEDFGTVVAGGRKMGDSLYAVSDRDGLAHNKS